MLKALIGTALILSAAVLPASAQNGPGIGRIAASQGYGAYVCTKDTNSRLIMRSEPTRNSRRLLEIPRLKTIQVIGERRGRDGFTWMRVTYNSTTGWVRSDFVCTNPESGQ